MNVKPAVLSSTPEMEVAISLVNTISPGTPGGDIFFCDGRE